MRRLAALLVRSFLQGLLILCPIAITGYIIYQAFDHIDRLVPISEIRGLSFVALVAGVTAVGYLGTRLLLGRMLIGGFGQLLEHTPGVKHLYSSIKDVMDSFVGDKKRFNQPVWVCTNRSPEIWRIGFLTRSELGPLGLEGMVSVYLPHSYAISGYVIITEAGNVRPITRMNAAEAMKFAVSGGIATMEEPVKTKPEHETTHQL